MYIDIAAVWDFIDSCICAVWVVAQLWFYGYGALWFYRNTKDEPKKEVDHE